MKNIRQMTTSTIIGLGMLGSAYAQSPKTSENTTATKDTLIENINNTDATSETIIKFMAGFLSKEEIEKLLIENDCKKTDSKYISIEPDTVLYETIQALEKKYGKTKITFAWPKSIDKSYDGHFSKHKNTIQINLKNIIETARNNSKGEQNTIGGFNFAGEIVDIRLTERSHKIQKITMKKKIRDIKTLVKNGLDYDQMYDTEGTVEYEAHTILEPEVINEFMETYASKIDTTNTQQVEKAEMVFDRYTYTKKEKDTTNKNLEFMLEKKDEIELKKMKIQAK